MAGPIRVEVDVAPGLPGFTVVGLADTAVQEARERVRGAIRNAGFAFPPRRLTVNLAPAELRKTGASLDLAMAIGILLGSEQVRAGPAAVGADRRAGAGRRGPAGPGDPADGRGPGCPRHRAPRAWPPAPSTRRGSSSGIEVDRSADPRGGRRGRPREAPGAPTGRDDHG